MNEQESIHLEQSWEQYQEENNLTARNFDVNMSSCEAFEAGYKCALQFLKQNQETHRSEQIGLELMTT